MSFEKEQIIDDAELSFRMYVEFVKFEIQESIGASAFQVLHPAPDNIPIGNLQKLAEAYRNAGLNAQVVPMEVDGEGYFGIKITS